MGDGGGEAVGEVAHGDLDGALPQLLQVVHVLARPRLRRQAHLPEPRRRITPETGPRDRRARRMRTRRSSSLPEKQERVA